MGYAPIANAGTAGMATNGSVRFLVARASGVEILVVLPDRGDVSGCCPLDPLESRVVALIAEQAAFARPP
jgi:hypothetical protein